MGDSQFYSEVERTELLPGQPREITVHVLINPEHDNSPGAYGGRAVLHPGDKGVRLRPCRRRTLGHLGRGSLPRRAGYKGHYY